MAQPRSARATAVPSVRRGAAELHGGAAISARRGVARQGHAGGEAERHRDVPAATAAGALLYSEERSIASTWGHFRPRVAARNGAGTRCRVRTAVATEARSQHHRSIPVHSSRAVPGGANEREDARKRDGGRKREREECARTRAYARSRSRRDCNCATNEPRGNVTRATLHVARRKIPFLPVGKRGENLVRSLKRDGVARAPTRRRLVV